METLSARSDSYSLGYDNAAGHDDLQDAYLSELLSYSLERLNKEPELLRADAERVRRQMQEVAVGHYRAFITAAEAVQSIRKEVSAVDGHLENLIAEIPKLTKGCNEFSEEAHSIVEKRRLNRTMLANHPTLLELLEIPQLMDTCVRNGNYDEALDLEAFVSKLATMHAKLPVIQTLAEDVRQITQAMLQQLLQRLRSNIQLPECLRVIAFLRRLAVFSEHDMRLQFLRCREAWLAEIIDDLDQSNPYDYLKRMTDCHRVQLFDVVTQYRAIFADDTSNQEESTDGGLLYSWAMHRVTAYLSVLASTLPKITDGGSLASVLEHCMYCGMSLGRVGLDFRGLLPPLFESCVQNVFVSNMAVATETFQHVLDLHRWVPMPPMGSAGRSAGRDDGGEDVAPPYSLMEHPPLAAFVNGVLAALNQLRHCAPTALKGALAAQVQRALQSVADMLLRYHDTRIVRDVETGLFLAMCRAFIEVACPYIALCFGRCYPGGGSLIDLRSVSEPVRRLVIASMPPPEESGAEEDEDKAEAGGDGEVATDGPVEGGRSRDPSSSGADVQSAGAGRSAEDTRDGGEKGSIEKHEGEVGSSKNGHGKRASNVNAGSALKSRSEGPSPLKAKGNDQNGGKTTKPVMSSRAGQGVER